MDVPLLKDQAVRQLWAAYKNTSEYGRGLIAAIPAHHRLVEDQERRGLRSIYQRFVSILASNKLLRVMLKVRSPLDWLNEWKEMHKLLFEYVLAEKGMWRKINVRFGEAGDEDLYRIPIYQLVPSTIGILAEQVVSYISLEDLVEDEKYKILAKIHYEFIRIHPFPDGNGRIARAVTDQLSLYFGFLPAMGGYPRHNLKNRAAYHRAIRSCIDDPGCSQLAMWIKSYVERQINYLA